MPRLKSREQLVQTDLIKYVNNNVMNKYDLNNNKHIDLFAKANRFTYLQLIVHHM